MPRRPVWYLACLAIVSSAVLLGAKGEKKVAAVTLPKEVERQIKKRMAALPPDVPREHRDMLFAFIRRNLMRERQAKQEGKTTSQIRVRSVSTRGAQTDDQPVPKALHFILYLLHILTMA